MKYEDLLILTCYMPTEGEQQEAEQTWDYLTALVWEIQNKELPLLIVMDGNGHMEGYTVAGAIATGNNSNGERL